MKFICLGYMDEKAFAKKGKREMQQFVDECFTYDKELQEKGHNIGGEGLQSVASAATLRWGNNKIVVTDGPFAETKEQLGGIMILEARDLDHAIELMSKHPSIRLGGTFEIRPAADLSGMIAESEQRRAKAHKN